MNCETMRARLAEDPARNDEEFLRHAADCVPCRAYRGRLLRAEDLVRKALDFDVGVVAAPVPDRASSSVWASRRAMGIAAIACGLLAAVTFLAYLRGRSELTIPELSSEIVAHWYHEPESWVRSDREISATLLAEVLGGAAEIDLARLQAVSYANDCRVGGYRVPHLVIQGERGPYMVLLLPGRSIDTAVPLELPAEGLVGHLVPAGSGSIAVLGDAAELEQVETAVGAAVSWSI